MKRSLLIFLIALLAVVFCSAQVYNFKNYSVEDGLAQSQILSICQDSKGRIIFGTNGGGISIYDGVRFTTLNENNGLINNVVFAVSELKNKKIACGTNSGLCFFNGKNFQRVDSSSGLPALRIFDVLEDADKLWLGTEQGVWIYNLRANKAEKFTPDSTLASSNVFNVYRDKSGSLWFCTIGFGVARLKANSISWYSTKNGLLDDFVRTVGEDHDGTIYIGANTGIHKLINDKPVLVDLPESNIAGFTSVLPAGKGVTWFASYSGLIKKEGDKTKRITAANGLISNNIWCSMIDREGNLWVGTEGYGAARFLGEYNYNYLFSSNREENVAAVFEDSKRNVWVAATNQGVYCLRNDGSVLNYRLNPNNLKTSLSDNTVHAIAEDRAGNLWFGTIAGLSKLSTSDGVPAKPVFLNFSGRHGLRDSSIFSLYTDKQGTLWIGTQDGLFSLRNDIITEETEVNKLRDGNELFTIHNIYEDNGGVLWLGTDRGVVKYNRKKAERIDASKGFTGRRVYTISGDSKGNLLFATDEGIFFYNHSTFENMLRKLKDEVHSVYSILIDKSENVWMGTSKGIDRLNLKEYRATDSTSIIHYGKAEGLRGLECNQNAAIVDAKNRLWFGTIKGTVVFDPAYERKNGQEAILQLSAIKLFYQDFDFTPYAAGLDSLSGLPIGLELPYDKNHITFDFIGVSQTNQAKVKYMFKLEGLDDTWYRPTYKNEITYSSLPPGAYTFYLKAMNNDGLWNKEPLTFSFKVLPPWYRTWWFYTLCAVALVGSIYAYTTIRTKALEKQKRVLEDQVDERTRELREEKEKVELINAEVISQKHIIETKNKDITDSINYAKNIQEALLPSVKMLEDSFVESFVLYMPKDIVSGDFYWFAKRGGKTFFAAVDCTGHGVPGAFMSIIGNSLLHEIVTERNILQPSRILDELHLGVKEALNSNKGVTERRDGMDIALCAYNAETRILEYAGANRPLWIFRNNSNEISHESVKANKYPIGGIELEEKREFTHHEMQMNPGDTVYVFSDGYADQFGGDRGKKFMLGNMQKAIFSSQNRSMKSQKQHLENIFAEWKSEQEQIDDVLVIGVKF